MSGITLVVARRGHGKTYLIAHLAKEWKDGEILVHDPMYCFSKFSWLENCKEYDVNVIPPPGTLVLLDEVDLLANTHKYSHDNIRKLIHYCRHYAITLICTARRPANIHRDLTALCDKVYLGKLSDSRDIDFYVEQFGPQVYQCRNLPLYKFIELDI